MRKCCQQQGRLCLAPPASVQCTQNEVLLASLPNAGAVLLHEKHKLPFQCSVVSVKTIDFKWSLQLWNISCSSYCPQGCTSFKVYYILHHLRVWLLCGKMHISMRYLAHYDMYSLQELDNWAVIGARRRTL